MYSFCLNCLFLFHLLPSYRGGQFILQGKCVGHDGSFCDSIFPNSICDPVKNECICPEGFVVVENNGHAICTTLLTDLRCTVDKECIHVDQSICHPGTGRCICSSDFIYVPLANGCQIDDGESFCKVDCNTKNFITLPCSNSEIMRKMATVEDNSLCLYCQRLRGVCYLEKSNKKDNRSHQSSHQVGCRCPPHPIRHVSGIYHSISFCQIHLVDRGQRCNTKSHLCRSRKAMCSQIENYELNSLCECPKFHVAVYQAQLEYYECYRILQSNSQQCESCVSNRGICYDNNDDYMGDGCLCPERFSTTSNPEEKEFRDQRAFCNFDHMTATCENQKMTVCYVPHQIPPYNKLKIKLQTGKSMAFLTNVNSTVPSGCQIVKSDPNQNYCITVDIVKNPCGLTTLFTEETVTIQGRVLVILNRDRTNFWNNIKMDFNCTSRFDFSKQNPRKLKESNKSFKAQPVSVNMNILDGSNKTRFIKNFQNISLEVDIKVFDDWESEQHEMETRILKAYSCSMNTDVKQKKFLSIFLVNEGCPEFSHSLPYNSDEILSFKLKIKPKYLKMLLSYQTNLFFIKCSFYICNETSKKTCEDHNFYLLDEHCLTFHPIQSYTYFRIDVPQASHSNYPVKSHLLSSDSHFLTIVILSMMIIVLVTIFSVIGLRCCRCFKRVMFGPPTYSSSNQFIRVSPDRYFNIISSE